MTTPSCLGRPRRRAPARLIPSRAARHQKKGRFRGRAAEPATPPAGQPQPEPPPPSRARRRAGSGGCRSGRSGRRPGRPAAAPGARNGPRPRRQGPRVRPVPDPAGRGAVNQPAEGAEAPPGPPGAPAPRPPTAHPQLGDLRGSSLGLAGALVAVAVALVVAVNALPTHEAPGHPGQPRPLLGPLGLPAAPRPGHPGDHRQRRGCHRLAAHPGAPVRPAVRPDHQAAGRRRRPAAALKPAKAGFVQVEAFSAPVVVSAPGLSCAARPGHPLVAARLRHPLRHRDPGDHRQPRQPAGRGRPGAH